MKIVCSSNMPYAREAFGTLGETVVLDGRAIRPADVRDADVLAVRSTTRVDRALLDGSAVRFVGTATIGTDHFDVGYLEQAGIRWCSAPGCNANGVSEYMTAAWLCLAERCGFRLEGRTLGVIGVGNVGRLVVAKAAALGMRVLPNDPPRARAEAGLDPRPSTHPFVSLDRVLAESDLLTLHVPLTREGPDATFHMANEPFFARMKPGCVFCNSARGAAVDSDALLSAMDAGTVARAVVDTWEDEPAIRADLLARVDLGTPHIAGHSFEGKVEGTVRVYREACRFLGREPDWRPDALLPPPTVPDVTVRAAGRSDESVLREVVGPVYDIEADDRALRRAPAARTLADHFDDLRKHYPVRREFRFTRVHPVGATPSLTAKLAALGFSVHPSEVPDA